MSRASKSRKPNPRGEWNRPPLTAPAPKPLATPPVCAVQPRRDRPWPVNEDDLDLGECAEPQQEDDAGAASDSPTPVGRRLGLWNPLQQRPFSPLPPAGEGPGERADHFLGSIAAEQRGISGPLTLDVQTALDGSRCEIGPFALSRTQTVVLCRLLGLAVTLMGGAPS